MTLDKNVLSRFDEIHGAVAEKYEARKAIFVDMGPKTNMLQDVKYLISVKFRLNSLRSRKWVSLSETGRPYSLRNRPEKSAKDFEFLLLRRFVEIHVVVSENLSANRRQVRHIRWYM